MCFVCVLYVYSIHFCQIHAKASAITYLYYISAITYSVLSPIILQLDAFLPKVLHFVPKPYHSLPSASEKQVSVLQTALCRNQTILSDSNYVWELS